MWPGIFRPPSIGVHVDPYPMSGRGHLAIEAGELRAEGGRGIPWQVQLGGLLGLVVGIAFTVLLVHRIHATLTLVGLVLFITAGTTVGYKLAGNHVRVPHSATFAPKNIVAVDSTVNEVLITISFRKRWQTRKQCLHFIPDDRSQIASICAAVDGVRSAA